MVVRDGQRVFNPRWLPALDLPGRGLWQRPDAVLEALALFEGATVADVGAGSGYFTEPLARHVGRQGLVYATDVQPEMVDALRERSARRGLENVVVVQAAYDDPTLPPACCDVVFLANVYKEIGDRVGWLRRVRRSLRPGGRLVVIGFRPDAPGVGPPREVRLGRDAVVGEAAAAGFSLVASHALLPRQYFLEFAPAPPTVIGEIRAAGSADPGSSP